MKRLRLVFAIVLLVTFGAPVGLTVARALTVTQGQPAAQQAVGKLDAGCSAASLKGIYGLNGQGFLGHAPLAFVGVLSFDGAGKFTGYHDENIGGNVGSATEAGDYSIGPDCHGVTHWTNHHHTNLPDHTHTITFVVVDGGKEAWSLGVANSPPGMDAPNEPDVIFWAALKRM
jgi:hypothetical protein